MTTKPEDRTIILENGQTANATFTIIVSRSIFILTLMKFYQAQETAKEKS